ncbi:TorF family putative porin [Polynucleobacter necessarius]|uniref:TorF family putative porin n=1 Tax=Polynucleobacter necessarius TaxID=576610 RepID=UPI000E08E583|nr:TorF family putative porin [Polynucleobacter necessarius]
MKTLHKKALSAAALALLTGLACSSAFAADTPTDPEDAGSPIAANVTIVNDYRYRGISQSNFKPAIQGGFDYAHESGFYIGDWNSSIGWISDPYTSTGNLSSANPTGKSVSAPIEMDFYAGYKKEFIGEGFASDVGILQCYYPTSGLPNGAINPNTTGLYAAQNFTFGPVTGFVKFSYALTNTFGNANSKGSYYPDLTVNYDTGVWGLSLNGHVGYQYIAGTLAGTTVSNSSLYTYTDWKVSVTKDFGGGLSGSVAYVGTNANIAGYYSPQNSNLGRSTGLISLTKTF